jgi:hypothetical protein
MDGRFVGEAKCCDGFNFTFELPLGTHLLEIVRWNDGEKDRKKFPLQLTKEGKYEVRFNYAQDKGVKEGTFISNMPDVKETMQASTIDMLRQP